MFIIQVSRDTELYKFYPEDGPEMAMHWLHLGKRLMTVIVQVSREKELIDSVQLYIGDVIEMRGNIVVTLWGETK